MGSPKTKVRLPDLPDLRFADPIYFCDMRTQFFADLKLPQIHYYFTSLRINMGLYGSNSKFEK